MKFSVEREHLLKPLQLANAVVERRQTLPILGNVMLELDGDQLRVTATDLEVEMSVGATQVSAERDGTITLPARKLLDICRTSPDGTLIRVEANADRAVVRAGRARFTLATLAPAEFPRMETAGESASMDLPANDFRRLLQSTQFAMAQQDVRYYLNGLLLEMSGSRLRAVATDGHRMAVGEMRVGGATWEARRVIAPRKSIIEMLRVLAESPDADATARLFVGSDHIGLVCGRVTFRSKLIEGSFPDYERVIPHGYQRKADVARDAFAAALGRAAILANEKLRSVRLEFEAGRLAVRASNTDSEEAEEELEAHYLGDRLEVGLNITYLQDALTAIAGTQVRLEFQDAASSILLTDPDDAGFQYVIMPMRL